MQFERGLTCPNHVDVQSSNKYKQAKHIRAHTYERTYMSAYVLGHKRDYVLIFALQTLSCQIVLPLVTKNGQLRPDTASPLLFFVELVCSKTNFKETLKHEKMKSL